MHASDLVTQLRAVGATLRVNGDRLQTRRVPPDLRDELHRLRDDVLALLTAEDIDRRHRTAVLEQAGALGWPPLAQWVDPIIWPPLGLPAGKCGSPGERASWEQFAASALLTQLKEADRLLGVIEARRAEPLVAAPPLSSPARSIPTADEEAALRVEILELCVKAFPNKSRATIAALPPMRAEYLREERDWLRDIAFRATDTTSSETSTTPSNADTPTTALATDRDRDDQPRTHSPEEGAWLAAEHASPHSPGQPPAHTTRHPEIIQSAIALDRPSPAP